MTDRRICEHCGAELSLRWRQGFCPLCGKSIMPQGLIEPLPTVVVPKFMPVTRMAKKRPEHESQQEYPPMMPPLSRVEEPPVPLGVRGRRRAKARKQQKPRVSQRDFALLMTGANGSQDPVLLFLSPMRLFFQNVITLGMRGVYWFRAHEETLADLAREEASLPEDVYRLWCVSLYAFLACVFALLWECYLTVWSLESVMASVFLKPALAFFCVSWISFRYILFWMRAVIIENVFSHMADVKLARSLRPFAPGPLLLWFFGSVYLQLHINRLIWAGVFKPLARAAENN